jgi:hypothetical protein
MHHNVIMGNKMGWLSVMLTDWLPVSGVLFAFASSILVGMGGAPEFYFGRFLGA